jgi:hypothetical protein
VNAEVLKFLRRPQETRGRQQRATAAAAR